MVDNLLAWINGWIKVACGITTILSFGFIEPAWDIQFTEWLLS